MKSCQLQFLSHSLTLPDDSNEGVGERGLGTDK